jgi:hypothetical protein
MLIYNLTGGFDTVPAVGAGVRPPKYLRDHSTTEFAMEIASRYFLRQS